ncbi:MAG: MATE family efflux transporter [Eubacteriales bacterium]
MEQKNNPLGSAPVTPLMFKLIIPATAAQFINLMYNMVDRIFIVRIPEIGETALTAVGVTFPILLIVSAFAAFAGQGAAPLASIAMGAKDQKRAEGMLGGAVMLILAFTVLIMVVVTLFQEEILYAFGASDATISYAMDYISVYIMGTIFVLISLGLNLFISAQGKAKIAMNSVLIGAIVNIVLDYIFIIQFNFGVKGAAYATIIAQACSAIWILCFLMGKGSSLKIRKEYLVFRWELIRPIMVLGFTPFVMYTTDSLVSITLNKSLQIYGELAFTGGGDIYVGVMTVLQSVMQMVNIPKNGLSQGAQPIMSYSYGARNYARVREVFWKFFAASMVYHVIGTLIPCLFPTTLALIFTDEPQWLSLVAETMPIYFAGIWAIGAQHACQNTFMALGQAKIALFLACLRKLFLLVPLAILFPLVTGDVKSIFVASPVADIVTSGVTFCLFLQRRKVLLPKDANVVT